MIHIMHIYNYYTEAVTFSLALQMGSFPQNFACIRCAFERLEDEPKHDGGGRRQILYEDWSEGC